MKNKVITFLASLAVLAMISPSVAKADQITLGDSCTGTISATSISDVTGPVSDCSASWEFGGSSTGGYSWDLGANGTSFSIDDGGSGLMTGDIAWDTFLSGGGIVVLVGQLTVDGVTSGLFDDQYSVGGVYEIDLTLNGAESGLCRTCSVSSGEVPVPEPGSLMLFGTGLLSMAGFLRRKLFG